MLSTLKKIIIAIDGHSSCGKSTLAQDLAKELCYIYIDTGAMYRAVTLYFLNNNIDLNDESQVADALSKINIEFVLIEKQNHTILNGVDVEREIRSMKVSDMVSEISTISAVRRFLVKQQQELGKQKGLVMDGRDIGTVVFPEAEFKIFLTAKPEIRAKRRQLEFLTKGIELSVEEIANNLSHRDNIDSNREDSPLKKADDAILFDNSDLTREVQLQKILKLVELKNNL